MNIIVDANIFKGYFQEAVIEMNHELTYSPRSLFEDSIHIIYIDENGKIKSEYENVLNNQWTKEFIINSLNSGKLRLINTKIDTELEKILSSKGFEKHSKDKWYIRTALELKEKSENNKAYIITEDIDFYDPNKKKCKSIERKQIIKSRKSPVCKELIKRKNIFPICVENYFNKAY